MNFLKPSALPLAVALIVGCAQSAPRTLTFNYGDGAPPDRLPIRMRTADSAVVTLHENRTTGYGWQVADRPDFCEVKLNSVPPSGDLCGAPGVCNVTIVPEQAGEGTVKLVYVRSWENVPPDKVAVIDLKVEN